MSSHLTMTHVCFDQISQNIYTALGLILKIDETMVLFGFECVYFGHCRVMELCNKNGHVFTSVSGRQKMSIAKVANHHFFF